MVHSKLWFAGEVHDLPRNVLTELNYMVKNFIWEGKYSQRSLEGLEEDYLTGGLRLGNIEKKLNSFRINWLSYLMNTDNSNIEYFLANKLISDNGLLMGFDILKGYIAKHLKTIKNNFYRKACLIWNKLVTFEPKNQNSVGNLWIYENILLKDDDGRVYKPLHFLGSIELRKICQTFSKIYLFL